TDEIGTLARAFNSMAAEVDRSREALREKLAEARRLAGELEESNKQFVEAMSDAERLRAEAESANQAKSRFLATMSHEIRTPINAIIGYTDLMTLEIPGSLTAVQRRHLERIRASGEQLVRLGDEVRDPGGREWGRVPGDAGLGPAREAIPAPPH